MHWSWCNLLVTTRPSSCYLIPSIINHKSVTIDYRGRVRKQQMKLQKVEFIILHHTLFYAIFTGKTTVHACSCTLLSCQVIIIIKLIILSHFLLWLIHNEVVKTQTDRQTHTQTDRQTDWLTCTHTHTHIHTHTHTHTQSQTYFINKVVLYIIRNTMHLLQNGYFEGSYTYMYMIIIILKKDISRYAC